MGYSIAKFRYASISCRTLFPLSFRGWGREFYELKYSLDFVWNRKKWYKNITRGKLAPLHPPLKFTTVTYVTQSLTPRDSHRAEYLRSLKSLPPPRDFLQSSPVRDGFEGTYRGSGNRLTRVGAIYSCIRNGVLCMTRLVIVGPPRGVHVVPVVYWWCPNVHALYHPPP